MQLEIHNGVLQRLHLKAVGADDAALGDVAVLNVERARGAGGEHVAGVPALDARVQGNEAGRNVRHVIDRVLRVDLVVVDALDLELEHVGHLVGRDELGAEGEERREVLDDGQIAGIAGHEVVALEDGFLGHVEDRGVADDGALPLLLGNVTAVAAHDDAEFRLRGGLLCLLELGQQDVVIRANERIRHLEEAAGEARGRGVADVLGVVGVIEADAEDALGIAVERGVDDLLRRHDAGDGLKLLLAALVVPLRQAGDMTRLNEAHHVLLPARTLVGVERGDGQDALPGDDAGDLRAVQLDRCESHSYVSLQLIDSDLQFSIML